MPASIANRAATLIKGKRRVLRRDKEEPPVGELTARRSYTPKGVQSKRNLPKAEFRSIIWAGVLGLASVTVAGLLVVEGYGLPRWWVVLGLAGYTLSLHDALPIDRKSVV